MTAKLQPQTCGTLASIGQASIDRKRRKAKQDRFAFHPIGPGGLPSHQNKIGRGGEMVMDMQMCTR